MTNRQRLLAAMGTGTVRPVELAAQLDKSPGSVRKMLLELHRDGLVTKPGYGLYQRVDGECYDVTARDGNSSGNTLTELSDEDKARIAKRMYMREWHRRNRERHRENQIRYWAKKYDAGLR